MNCILSKYNRVSKGILAILSTVLLGVCSGNKSNEKASENTPIGREFSDFSEIVVDFQTGQFASHYSDSKYGVTIGGQKGIKDVWHVYFTLITGYNGNNPRYRLLDSIIVDLKGNDSVQLTLGSCECRNRTNDCLAVAVYNRHAPRGSNQPILAWLPDLQKRKFIPISPTELDCESEADVTDEP